MAPRLLACRRRSSHRATNVSGVIHDDEDHRDDKERRDQIPFRRGQRLSGPDQFLVEDKEAKGRILQDHHELADNRRQHQGDGLGEQDLPQRAERSQADGQPGFALTCRQRANARSDQFGDDAGVVEREPRHHPVEREIVTADLKAEEEYVVGKQHHHQDGDCAEEFDEYSARPTNRPPVGQSSHAEGDTEHEAEDDGVEGGDQRPFQPR